jgi:hypothetical protein
MQKPSKSYPQISVLPTKNYRNMNKNMSSQPENLPKNTSFVYARVDKTMKHRETLKK